MSYAAKQDLIDTLGEDELVQLSDRDLDGVADDAVVEQVLQDVDAVIDGYVGTRYDLPLPQTPALLRTLAIELAHERFYVHGAPEAVANRAKRATDTLKDIAAGRAKLDVAGSEPDSAPAEAEVVGPDRVFSRERMKGY